MKSYGITPDPFKNSEPKEKATQLKEATYTQVVLNKGSSTAKHKSKLTVEIRSTPPLKTVYSSMQKSRKLLKFIEEDLTKSTSTTDRVRSRARMETKSSVNSSMASKTATTKLKKQRIRPSELSGTSMIPRSSPLSSTMVFRSKAF